MKEEVIADNKAGNKKNVKKIIEERPGTGNKKQQDRHLQAPGEVY